MAICEKCIKKSFCKLCDGSEIRGCTYLVVSSELEKNSKKLEKATTKNDLGVDVPDNNVGNIDCISRSDAIKAIQKYGVGCLDADDFSPEQSERFVINKLNELPSVTPQEPRKGHWVTRPHVYGVTYCSECGFELKIDDTNYCPNCGADMRKVEE